MRSQRIQPHHAESSRLPQSSGNALEIAVTPETATILHLHSGSTLTVPFSFFLDMDTPSGNVIKLPVEQNLHLHIVGIYQVDRPDDAFWQLREYAFIAVLVSVATMIVAVYRALNTSILSVRRESARSTQHPLWQRLRLDLVVAIIALTGYGVSLYVTNVQEVVENARFSVLIAAPLSLIAPLFLIIGIILLLSRFIPLFLRLRARLMPSH